MHTCMHCNYVYDLVSLLQPSILGFLSCKLRARSLPQSARRNMTNTKHQKPENASPENCFDSTSRCQQERTRRVSRRSLFRAACSVISQILGALAPELPARLRLSCQARCSTVLETHHEVSMGAPPGRRSQEQHGPLLFYTNTPIWSELSCGFLKILSRGWSLTDK